jgi:predicted kinase
MGCIPAENFIKANDVILPKIKETLSKGKIIILDACFYHKEPIEHLIRNLPFPHYVFTLKAPLEVCVKRDSKRKKVYGKDATKAVHKLVSRFDYGIIINTKDKTVNQVAKEILSYLPKQ